MRASVPAVVLLAVSALACNSNDRRIPLVSASAGAGGSASSVTGGTTHVASGSSGAGGSDSGGAAAHEGGEGGAFENGTGGEGTGGSISITEVDPSECDPLDVSGIKVMDSGANNPAFDAMGTLGTRLYALARDSLALMTFDPDGANASSFLYGAVAAAPHEQSLHVLFDDTSKLYLHRYDPALVPLGTSIELAAGGARAPSVAANAAGDVLALWAGALGFEGRLIAGATQTEVAIQEPLAATSRCNSVPAAKANGFNIAWTCLGSRVTVGWALVDERGRVSGVRSLLTAESPLRLMSHTHTTDGDLLLLNEGSAESVVVAHVGPGGVLSEPLHRYGGVSGFGLAAGPDSVGMIAATEDGRTMLRVLARDGSPKTTWKCLDDVAPGGHGAIMARNDGYSVVVRHDNGSAWLIDLDADGQPLD